TAMLLPHPYDPSKPTEVIFYFHGHNGSIANSLNPAKTGLSDVIQQLAQARSQAGGHNVAIVLPQGPVKARDYTWMNAKNGESLATFQAEALERLLQLAPGLQIGKVTLKGHSAGGLPLLNGATAGGIRADRVDFLDASYGSWASGSWNQFKKHGLAPEFNLVYLPGTSTQADALRLKGKAGVNLLTTSVSHGQVPKAFLGR
ncbi:MAG: hypothetical protein CVV27_02870, partial [Candidatus Melainabacteria bacterium HGW-Melainabacteria-1]